MHDGVDGRDTPGFNPGAAMTGVLFVLIFSATIFQLRFFGQSND